MNQEKKVIALIIHGFTISHMIAAGIAGPAAGAILTPMTVGMVVCIGLQCKVELNTQTAVAILSDFVGFILGVSMAEFILGLIPGVGNIANALASGFVTELLGWLTYIVLKDNKSTKKSKTFLGKMSLLKEAANLRNEANEYNKKLKETRNKMDEFDREKYDNLMKLISNKDTIKSEQDRALLEIEKLLKKYGMNI